VYGALWRIMPGPVWLRIVLMVVFFAVILAALVAFVFPWLNTFVNVNDVTVGTNK
jgi:uncharacterized membrane protein (DUF485 family)